MHVILTWLYIERESVCSVYVSVCLYTSILYDKVQIEEDKKHVLLVYCTRPDKTKNHE